MLRQEIDQWLAGASLPPTIERRLNDEGEWYVELSGAVLTLSVDEVTHEILFSVPLARFDEETPTAFYRALLSLQLHGELPPGFHFLKEEKRLYLVGRQRADALDAMLFDRLLQETLTVLLTLPVRLRLLMKSVRQPEPGRRRAVYSADGLDRLIGTVSAEPSDEHWRSDEAFLERRLSESIRI